MVTHTLKKKEKEKEKENNIILVYTIYRCMLLMKLVAATEMYNMASTLAISLKLHILLHCKAETGSWNQEYSIFNPR